MSSHSEQQLAVWQNFLMTPLEDKLARHRHDGCETALLALFHEAAETVPAYRNFLAAHEIAPQLIKCC